MMIRLYARRAAGWLGAGRAARAVSSAPKKSMTLDAQPQVLVAATGLHQPTVVRDLTAAIYELGASVTATKKAVLGEHYSLLMSVWLPGAQPNDAARKLNQALAQSFSAPNTNLTLIPLEPKSAAAITHDAETVTRRLRVSCPQKPGVVLAITRLLQDHGATTSHMEAGTSAKGGTIWFELECLVELSPQVVDEVAQQLQFWSESSGASLNFD